MIALDTSAVLAIILDEPEGEPFGLLVAGRTAMVSAPTVVEARLALERRAGTLAEGLVANFIARRSVAVVSFDAAMIGVALDAFRRYGKGRGHPAQLNFGDCLSYALAKSRNLPLLYKGNDFARTDLVPAYAPLA